MKLEPIKWHVVNKDDSAAICLTPAGYEAMSRNMGEIVRWTKGAEYQMNFYRETRKSGTTREELP